MTRTKLIDRELPNYTLGEERFNMISHVVGGGFAIIIMLTCVIVSAWRRSISSLMTSAVYGGTMVLLYTMSSLYHGLTHPMAKKVLQVLDHCAVYLLIAGTYTPLALCSIRSVNPALGWGAFGFSWGVAIIAIIFTAIDLKRFRILSMICYLGIGWVILFAAKSLYESLGIGGLLLLLGGGVLYTVGSVLYGIGKKKRYMHSVFHIFVVLGSLAHFFCILFYVI